MPCVLRLRGVGPRATARAATREAARAALTAWCGGPVTWRETATGPRPDGPAMAADFQVSFTYAGADAWIALHRGPVGLDACPIADFPERTAVTRLYLPDAPPGESPEAFAQRWARREAVLKHARRPLSEGPPPPAPAHLIAGTEAGVALALAWS
jgi:hypothetical protein